MTPQRTRRARDEREYATLRRELLGGSCEVCPRLGAVGVIVYCTRVATELHHRRKRSSSGALANPANVVPCCHSGNMAVEDWPTAAHDAGLVVREGDPDWHDLSARAWRNQR